MLQGVVLHFLYKFCLGREMEEREFDWIFVICGILVVIK